MSIRVTSMARFSAFLSLALPMTASCAELATSRDRSSAASDSCPQRDVDEGFPSQEEAAFFLLQAGAARRAGRRTPSAAGPARTASTEGLLSHQDPPKLFFFSHHKAGTVLSARIAADMTRVLGSFPPSDGGWFHVKSNATLNCLPGDIGVYEDMRVPLLSRIIAHCPNMRAVHLIREASSTLVSNYVYTRNLGEGEEYAIEVRMGERLRNMSLEEGLAFECPRDTKIFFPQMVATHEAIQALGMESILTVRYEDWMDNFDNVTMSMLVHFLGEGHPQLDEIFQRAKTHDISTWNESQLEASHHVSDTEQKAAAAAYLLEMYDNGDSCVHSLVDVNNRLGYYGWFPNESMRLFQYDSMTA